MLFSFAVHGFLFLLLHGWHGDSYSLCPVLVGSLLGCSCSNVVVVFHGICLNTPSINKTSVCVLQLYNSLENIFLCQYLDAFSWKWEMLSNQRHNKKKQKIHTHTHIKPKREGKKLLYFIRKIVKMDYKKLTHQPFNLKLTLILSKYFSRKSHMLNEWNWCFLQI
jgi:hypothetical protein